MCKHEGVPNSDRTEPFEARVGESVPVKCMKSDSAATATVDMDCRADGNFFPQMACRACEAGKQPNTDWQTAALADPTADPCVACEGNEYSTFGTCQACRASEYPNPDRTACVACPEGIAQTSIGGACACATGYYNTSHGAKCLAADFVPTEPALLSCQPCDELADCADQCGAGALALLPGWTLLARADGSVSIFQCGFFPLSESLISLYFMEVLYEG